MTANNEASDHKSAGVDMHTIIHLVFGSSK